MSTKHTPGPWRVSMLSPRTRKQWTRTHIDALVGEYPASLHPAIK